MPLRTQKTTVTVAASGTASTSLEMPNWASFCIVRFPQMTDGDIGIAITLDNSTYEPLVKSDGSADFVACASGVDPGWVDISDHVRALPSFDSSNHAVKFRFTCAAQAAERTISVFFKE